MLGVKAYLIHSGACPGGGGSGSLNCSEGRGAQTPFVSWGWRGLKKNISGTALRCRTIEVQVFLIN